MGVVMEPVPSGSMERGIVGPHGTAGMEQLEFGSVPSKHPTRAPFLRFVMGKVGV